MGESDYYGQNFTGAQLREPTDNGLQDIEVHLAMLRDLNQDEAVRYVLKLEYQHLLPQLVHSYFHTEYLDPKSIHLPNERQFALAKADTDYKEQKPLEAPLCIVRSTPDNKLPYVLVDGYHRLAQFVLEKSGCVHAIVAKSPEVIDLKF
jgi:hypothetical protein